MINNKNRKISLHAVNLAYARCRSMTLHRLFQHEHIGSALSRVATVSIGLLQFADTQQYVVWEMTREFEEV